MREAAAATLTPSTAWTSSADLADGTCPKNEFAYYLAQDAIYLNGYSRVLARASAIAPTEAEQLFWARSAQQCLEVESELHRTWLSTRTVEPALGPVTKSYVDHCWRLGSGSYAVLVAASACWPPRSPAATGCWWPPCCRASGSTPRSGRPCTRQFLAAGAPEAHPYAEWLRTYADEEFAAATRQAIAYRRRRGRAASAGEREAMALAFRQSCPLRGGILRRAAAARLTASRPAQPVR